MAEFDLENFEKYLSKNPEKKERKTWKFKENSGYSEKKFLIEATDYSEFGTVSETEKLRFNEEDLTESFFDEQNSLIRKVLKEYLKQEEQEEKSPKKMTTRLVFSPLVKSDFQPTVDSVDKNINFYCRGLNYEGKEIQNIILDAKNVRDDVVGHYLVKKCLLDFDVYDEIKKIGETTLSFPHYRLNGFFRDSYAFRVLKISEGRNNTLKIEINKNLFNSSSKTLFLPKNNELVKEIILSKKKTQTINDEEIGVDMLEVDWSEIEGKTFIIENINGEKCYFENDCLVLNDFERISEFVEDEQMSRSSSESSFDSIGRSYNDYEFAEWLKENKPQLYNKEALKVYFEIYHTDTDFCKFIKKIEEQIKKWNSEWSFKELVEAHFSWGNEYYKDKKYKPECCEIKDEDKEEMIFIFNFFYQNHCLKQELNKTKSLLDQKEQEIERLKDKSPEEYQNEKDNLVQQLNQANQRIKELEEYSAKTEQRLKELHNFAKNGSSSSSSIFNQSNNSLKTQLTELRQEQQEWKNKLVEEKKKNKDLETQIKNYQSQNKSTSSKTVWETLKKPLLISVTIAGGLFLIFLTYKLFIARYFK